jgi:periplasmic protein TonB
VKRCPHCGQQDHDDAILCKACFKSFAEAPAGALPAVRAAQLKRRGGSPLLMLLVLLGIPFAWMLPELVERFAAGQFDSTESPRDNAATEAQASDAPAPDRAPNASPEPAIGAPATPVANETREASPTTSPGPPPVAANAVAPVFSPPRSTSTAERSASQTRSDRGGRGETSSVAPGRRTDEPRPATPNTAPAPAAPPSPPPDPPVRTSGAMRVGGAIPTPVKTRDVRPTYPPIAQTARVQGVVIVEATIAVDGRVESARVLRSIPLLDDAALDAVKQWRYQPTIVDGVAVPVIMTVTVQFSLR